MDDRFAKLDEEMRSYLRAIRGGRRSKEIARDAGVSPDRVNHCVKRAMLILGVSDRRTAAALLATEEERATSGGYPSPELAETIPQPPFVTYGNESIAPPMRMHDHHATYHVAQAPSAKGWFSLPGVEGDRNDLSIAAKLAMIASMTGRIVLAAAALIAVAYGANQAFGRHF